MRGTVAFHRNVPAPVWHPFHQRAYHVILCSRNWWFYRPLPAIWTPLLSDININNAICVFAFVLFACYYITRALCNRVHFRQHVSDMSAPHALQLGSFSPALCNPCNPLMPDVFIVHDHLSHGSVILSFQTNASQFGPPSHTCTSTCISLYGICAVLPPFVDVLYQCGPPVSGAAGPPVPRLSCAWWWGCTCCCSCPQHPELTAFLRQLQAMMISFVAPVCDVVIYRRVGRRELEASIKLISQRLEGLDSRLSALEGGNLSGPMPDPPTTMRAPWPGPVPQHRLCREGICCG